MEDPSHAHRSELAHVVFVVPVLQPAGAERVVAELAKRLPAQGFSTSVICLEDETAPIGRELMDAGVSVKGLHVHRRRSMRAAGALLNELPSARPLIINSHLFHANLAVRLAVARMGRSEREGIFVLSTVQVAERRWRPWQFMLDRLTARHAIAEICVSRAVARFQQEKTGLPASFFPVIESGIDLAPLLNSSPPDDRSGKAGGLHVVSLGRLSPQKDYPTLLRAWTIVTRHLPGARLSIAGQGPELDRLQSLCKTLGLTNVTFKGFTKDIAGFLREGDVYVQPSAYEGFGLAVAEAMACGLPVVVTDVDSLPELVTHDETGLVVPQGQPAPMADAILKLLRDRDRARVLGDAAKAEAIRRFSVERMVRDYADLFRKTLRHGSDFDDSARQTGGEREDSKARRKPEEK
jgi:glycosyltransferase involved in cell wall biosynthesis